MIASPVTGVERRHRSEEEIARELEDPETQDIDGIELETAPRPGLEEELGDDEIGRASEELPSDEG